MPESCDDGGLLVSGFGDDTISDWNRIGLTSQKLRPRHEQTGRDVALGRQQGYRSNSISLRLVPAQ